MDGEGLGSGEFYMIDLKGTLQEVRDAESIRSRTLDLAENVNVAIHEVLSEVGVETCEDTDDSPSPCKQYEGFVEWLQRIDDASWWVRSQCVAHDVLRLCWREAGGEVGEDPPDPYFVLDSIEDVVPLEGMGCDCEGAAESRAEPALPKKGVLPRKSPSCPRNPLSCL